MSDLLEKKVDKFHNKTELVTKQVTLWSNSELYEYGLSGQRNDIKASFRYWSTDEGETILLDVDYGGPDWLFLREGDIVIRINETKNIELKPSGEDSDVHANEQHKIICREVLYYEVKKEDFIDMCTATSLEFQISGSRNFVNGKADQLQAVGRILYNELYGKDLPVEIKERVKGLVPLTLVIAVINTIIICNLFHLISIKFTFQYIIHDMSWGFIFLLVALGVEAYISTKSKKAAIVSSFIAIVIPIFIALVYANI